MLLLLIVLLPLCDGYIEDTLQEQKPRLTTPFPDVIVQSNDFPDESEESPIQEATIYLHRRTPREIHDPVADYLDMQAVNEIHKDKMLQTGPPSTMPKEYEEQNRHRAGHKAQTVMHRPGTVQNDRAMNTQHGPAIVSSRTRVLPPNTRLAPYDAAINPDFPIEAPRARGLVTIPEGWNSNSPMDWEFKSGYRWNTQTVQRPSSRGWTSGMRGTNANRASLLPIPRVNQFGESFGSEAQWSPQVFARQPFLH